MWTTKITHWCHETPTQFVKFIYITIKCSVDTHLHRAHVFLRKIFWPLCYLHPDTINKVIYRRRENVEKLTFFARTE
jgi:hypothetical protein